MNNLEDQFRDRRYVLMLILLIISVGVMLMLFFWEIPESNKIPYGIISGFVFSWTADALKDYFQHMRKQANEE